jgi:hypothetical protein
MGIFPSPLLAWDIGHIDAQEQFPDISTVLEPEERNPRLSQEPHPQGTPLIH